MKPVSIRIDEITINNILEFSKESGDNSIQETYRKLLELGLSVAQKKEMNIGRVLRGAFQNTVELKYYIKNLYLKTLDDEEKKQAQDTFKKVNIDAIETVKEVSKFK
jgi:hypothetical protein